MSKKRTLPENIRRYKQEYLRLGVLEAKLNQQLYRMKKRIKLLDEEEELRLSEKALLSELLQHVQQEKTDLESQPASKKRDTQLKRVVKEYKKVKAKHSRNQYQLDNLEVKKDRDNVVKLILKEVRRDDVRLRMESAYETWMYLEQMEQYQAMDFETFQALYAAQHQSDSTAAMDNFRAEHQENESRLLQNGRVCSPADSGNTKPRLVGFGYTTRQSENSSMGYPQSRYIHATYVFSTEKCRKVDRYTLHVGA